MILTVFYKWNKNYENKFGIKVWIVINNYFNRNIFLAFQTTTNEISAPLNMESMNHNLNTMNGAI